MRVFAPMFLLEVSLAAGAQLTLPDEHIECGVFVADGAVESSGLEVPATRMAVQAGPSAPALRAREASWLVLFDGAPLDGEQHL